MPQSHTADNPWQHKEETQNTDNHNTIKVKQSVSIRESPPQFENRIMAQVYVSSTSVVLCTKKLHFDSRNWPMENKFCSMWVQLY